MKLTPEELQSIADDAQNLAPATFMKGRAKGPEVKLPPPQPMNTDTPPQPAHGELWPTIYLDDSIRCFGDVRRQDTDEQYIHIQPVGPGGSKERNDQRQAIGQRVADTWNLLSPHPDLSAVEVHSKETMDEVRE